MVCSSNWHAHERTHVGDKRYGCRVGGCKRKFAHPSSRNDHEMKVHGVSPGEGSVDEGTATGIDTAMIGVNTDMSGGMVMPTHSPRSQRRGKCGSLKRNLGSAGVDPKRVKPVNV